jgi:TRAP transporter TAXI family solute receptor
LRLPARPKARAQRARAAAGARPLALVVALACVGAALAPPVRGQADEGDYRELVIGTGPAGGVYRSLGEALERAMNDKTSGLVYARTRPSSGSVANIHALANDEAQLALVQADVLYAAVTGGSPFSRPIKAITTVAALYGETVHVIARRDAGIRSIADLAGKRVAIGAEGSGNLGVALRLLAAHGVERDALQTHRLSVEETLARFRARQIDAFFLTTAAPSEAAAAGLAAGGTLLPVDRIRAAALADKEPYLRIASLGRGTYDEQVGEVDVVQVDAVLAARDDVRPEIAFEVLEVLFERKQQIADAAPAVRTALLELDEARASTGAAMPMHPGAMQFFRTQGSLERTTEVHVGVYVNDVYDVDLAAGRFSVDFYAWFRWRGRLDAENNQLRFEVMNGDARLVDEPFVERFGGWTHITYRVHQFLETQSLHFAADDTVGGEARDLRRTMVEPGLDLGEWELLDVRHAVDDHVYDTDMGSPSSTSSPHMIYSRYRFELEIHRELLPYLVKFLVPLGIALLLAYLPFWMHPSELQVRVILAVAALLACVVFHLSQADQLPEVGYLIAADKFFMSAYALVVLALVEITAINGLYHKNRTPLALRIDRVARWLFPVLTAAPLVWVLSR